MRGLAARSTMALALALLALAFTASSGTAAAPRHVPILGVVPHAPQLAPSLHALSTPFAAAAAPTALTFDASYETLINQYLTDVAADSGGNQNVYSVATQYYDNPGTVPIQYQSPFGGFYVARDPLPANGCADGTDTYCLTDDQLQAEIQTVLTAKGWHGGSSNVFFLITPNGVGSCFDSFGNDCTTNAFCAYHSAFLDTNDEAVIYANEPYLGPTDGCTDSTQGFPNDTDSDTTINTLSHEHNEAITDPFGDAWIAADQNENGDLCAYGFGPPMGGTPGAEYNQVINTHHYELQQEYSNADSGCVQSLHGPSSPATFGNGPLLYGGGQVMHTNTTYAIYWLPTPGSTSPPVVTGAAGINQTLTTTNGAWTGAPSGFSDQWQRCSATGTSCVDIAGATASTYQLTSADLGHALRSTVHATNVNGTTVSPSAATATVVPVPAARKAPHISGRAHGGKKLSGSRGSWKYAPTRYRYQWLRCNTRGGSCSSIRRATHSTYRLTSHDAGHRLKVRVTAINAAGRGTATSRATASVPA
jgi:hypothetical protein